MNQALNQLLTLLQLEKIGHDTFVGQSQDIGLPRVFGGQLMGQGLYAAQQTVSRQRQPHALQASFLRPARCEPLHYQVTVLRDGRSFSSRRLEAFQQDQLLLTMIVSFKEAEPGMVHQKAMPDAPSPETLENETAHYAKLATMLPGRKPLLPALEIRPVEFHDPLHGHVSAPVQQTWLRASEPLPQALQFCVLAYLSDSHFLTTALQPHGLGLLETGMQVATLNHSLWFQRPFSLHDWLLYHVESPSACDGRGLVRGEFYTKDRQLVACSAQEGVMRRWPVRAQFSSR